MAEALEGLELLPDQNDANGHAFDVPLRGRPGRQGLDETLLIFGVHGHDDLVGRKRRERVANREIDVRLPGPGVDRLGREEPLPDARRGARA